MAQPQQLRQSDPVSPPAASGEPPNLPHTTSFHRRELPSPPAIAFSSEEGRQIFREALAEGYMEGYFLLAEQFRTQDEPAYCGLATLTMVLNALAVDPGRTWKGVWRWYNEGFLDCCRDLDSVQQHGIPFDELLCLAECHGLSVTAKTPQQPALQWRKGVTAATVLRQDAIALARGDSAQAIAEGARSPAEESRWTEAPPEWMMGAVVFESPDAKACCVQGTCNSSTAAASSTADPASAGGTVNATSPVVAQQPQDKKERRKSAEIVSPRGPEHARCSGSCADACAKKKADSLRRLRTEENFRREVREVCAAADAPMLLVSYSRKRLGQTGDGHFSPVGGYHAARDLVLLLDTARFKYPPHWVPLPLLYHAMRFLDEDTGRPRGWIGVDRTDKLEEIFAKTC